MIYKNLSTLVCLLTLAVTAAAQTKISGTQVCAKPDQMHMLEVADQPGHMLGLLQGKCTWSKPVVIAGATTKDDLSTGAIESHGNKATTRGYDIGTMSNGDKIFVRVRGTSTLKDGMVVTDEGKWSFTGGTGKLKGIKGEGTYKGKASGETEIFEIEGEYQLPGM